MKLIHCADVHLDSPLKRLGSEENRKQRKAELLLAFTNMIKYAEEISAKAIIIAGDLFDQRKVLKGTAAEVIGAIKKHPGIDFYYLKGNHDKNDFLENFEDESAIPKNLHLFKDTWTYCDLGEGVVLSGVELTAENSASIYADLSLNNDNFNIVTLHGQEAGSIAKDNAQIISLKDLKNKGIDYLALGHVHAYKKDELDKRGTYCYPGCLESRGFDETGDHGYMVLDIDTENRSFTLEKKSMPIREAHIVSVDITGLMDSTQIKDKIQEILSSENHPSIDMVKVELTGEVDIDCEKNIEYLTSVFKNDYFDFKLKDESKIAIDYERYKGDPSLKGEFIRVTLEDESIPESEKAEIIKLGIRVLTDPDNKEIF